MNRITLVNLGADGVSVSAVLGGNGLVKQKDRDVVGIVYLTSSQCGHCGGREHLGAVAQIGIYGILTRGLGTVGSGEHRPRTNNRTGADPASSGEYNHYHGMIPVRHRR